MSLIYVYYIVDMFAINDIPINTSDTTLIMSVSFTWKTIWKWFTINTGVI